MVVSKRLSGLSMAWSGLPWGKMAGGCAWAGNCGRLVAVCLWSLGGVFQGVRPRVREGRGSVASLGSGQTQGHGARSAIIFLWMDALDRKAVTGYYRHYGWSAWHASGLHCRRICLSVQGDDDARQQHPPMKNTLHFSPPPSIFHRFSSSPPLLFLSAPTLLHSPWYCLVSLTVILVVTSTHPPRPHLSLWFSIPYNSCSLWPRTAEAEIKGK